VIFLIVEDKVGVADIADIDEKVDPFIEEEIGPFGLGRDLNLRHGVGACCPQCEDTEGGESLPEKSHS